MEHVYFFKLFIIAVLCFVGVFSHSYEDTLIQRVGMAVAGTGACLRLYLAVLEPYLHSSEPLRWLFTSGVAIYAVGTAIKHFRKFRNEAL